MFGKIATYLVSFSLAFVILVFSIVRSSQVEYVFSQAPTPTPSENQVIGIDYNLPYPGRVLPDNFFWPIKALRDKFWLFLTPNHLKKAEILLLQADKRLVAAESLFDKDKPELGVATLTKAEKYLEEAFGEERLVREKGIDTSDFIEKLAYAALKHREVMERILDKAPEDARGDVLKSVEYPKRLYSEIKSLLIESGKPLPLSPFEDQK